MHFELYENIKMSKGIKRYSLLDLQNNLLYFIPVKFGDKIESKRVFSHSDTDLSVEQFNELIDLQIIKKYDANHVSAISSFEFDYPATISNAIVEISSNNLNYLEDINKYLKDFGCPVVSFVIVDTIRTNILKRVVSTYKSIQIIIASKEYDEISLVKLFRGNQNIVSLVFTDFPLSKKSIVLKDNFGALRSVSYTCTPYNSKLCGLVAASSFLLNYQFYTESLHHNSCLNRKISIDAEGNIKNCPSMKESFGNIRDTTLAEAIEKPGFKEYWDINKDKIHVCKDCEFRYICTDCRAYVEDPEDILSKPLKCGYNPYTGEWSEWSTNPLKQKAIDFYGMKESVNKL